MAGEMSRAGESELSQLFQNLCIQADVFCTHPIPTSTCDPGLKLRSRFQNGAGFLAEGHKRSILIDINLSRRYVVEQLKEKKLTTGARLSR
jgi:hypothetical protein